MSLILLAAVVRGAYFIQLNQGPCIRLHRWEQTDMNYFHTWGQAIAGGDLLSETVGVPLHAWHHEVAARWFARHPEIRTQLEQKAAQAGGGQTADAILWSKWNGGHQYYQDPLHAYMIGATYALLGADARLVIAWQMLFGIVSIVLIYLIARRYFGDTVAAIAGALAVFCGPLVYYEGLLLRDSTIACASLGVVWLIARAIDTRRMRWFALAGALLGLGVMLKSTFALLAVLVTAGVALALRGRGPVLRPVAVLVAGMFVALAPFAARNVALGVSPLAMAGSGTLTFVASNDPGYPATGGFFINEDQLADILGRTDGRAVPAMIETVRAHGVANLVALAWRRIQATWHWYEVPNNVSFYYVRVMAPVLGWLPVTFYVLAPLGLVGLALSARRWRDDWPLLALVAATVVSLAAFLVLGRLRMVLLAAVIPFAALAVIRCLRAPRAVQACSVAAVVLIGLWTGRPLPPERPLIDLTDWLTPFLVEYKDEVKAAMDAHDDARAADAYLAFLRYEPDFSSFARSGSGLASPSDREVARTFSQIHAVCGQFLRAAGKASEADAQFHRAEELSRLSSTR